MSAPNVGLRSGRVTGITCPGCGAPLVPVSASHPLTRERTAVLRCETCRMEQVLQVRLVELGMAYAGNGETRCGQPGGVRAHRDAGEEPCKPCKAAKAQVTADYRARTRVIGAVQ